MFYVLVPQWIKDDIEIHIELKYPTSNFCGCFYIYISLYVYVYIFKSEMYFIAHT